MLINPDHPPARRINEVERKKTPSVTPVKKVEKTSKPHPIDKNDGRKPRQEISTISPTQPKSIDPTESQDLQGEVMGSLDYIANKTNLDKYTEDQTKEPNKIDRKY